MIRVSTRCSGGRGPGGTAARSCSLRRGDGCGIFTSSPALSFSDTRRPSRVTAGPVRSLRNDCCDFRNAAHLVLHTCDTAGASSGSPLLLFSAAGALVVVAAIGLMMQLAGEGRARREGTRMGLWGDWWPLAVRVVGVILLLALQFANSASSGIFPSGAGSG